MEKEGRTDIQSLLKKISDELKMVK
jgi:hypothetical protein